jgi:hypothetical protein
MKKDLCNCGETSCSICETFKGINKEWTVICKAIQILQKRRVQIYKEAEEINPGKIVLKVEKSPSIYFDLEGNDIDQFLNER